MVINQLMESVYSINHLNVIFKIVWNVVKEQLLSSALNVNRDIVQSMVIAKRLEVDSNNKHVCKTAKSVLKICAFSVIQATYLVI